MDKTQIEAIYALSPLQQGLLFHSLYAPDQGVYVQQLSATIDGPVDLETLEHAWQRAIARHPILRTAFVWEQLDKPVQVVQRQARMPIEQHDWRGVPAEQQERQLQQLILEHRQRGFDLTRAPLMRLVVVRAAEQTSRLVWLHHHLLLDGWSSALLLREVFEGYAALLDGRELRPAPARPYRDYITWLKRQDLAAAETFWRAELRGFGGPAPLAIDRPAQDAPQAAEPFAQEQVVLAPAVSAALQALARRHELTLNTLVQGVWALALSRYSGEQDVLFGMTVAGRPADLPGVESMIGLFINTLPMRVRVAPDQPLLDWLRAVQARQVELRQYEYSPLAQIQSWSEAPRGQGLFESLLVFENYPVDEALGQAEGRLAFRDVRALERTNYPLTLVAIPRRELTLRLLYATERFSAAAVAGVLDYLRTLLEQIAAAPARRVAELPRLTEAERRALAGWNATDTGAPRPTVLHLFAAQAARAPQAAALHASGATLTYADLERRANQLAHMLRGLGVGPETRVGLCLERSPELVVAILGVLKAGGAYVPLDPSYPRGRLEFMLADAGVQALLTQEHLRQRLPECSAPVVCLDSAAAELAARPTDPAPAAVGPANLAYVLYTSGSTGRPKGVMITHDGLSNYLTWAAETYRVADGQGALLHSSISFDLTVTSLLTPLISGRAVTLLGEGAGVEELADALRGAHSQSLLKLTPAHLRALNQLLPGEELAGRAGALVVGGEALLAEMLAPWRQHAPATRLINEYGPTETVVGSCVYEVGPDDPQTGSVAIGRPIANTQVYLLDRALLPVPPGVPGELYIGGAGVARGYQGRPDLTAERFVPNPFATDQRRTTNDETGVGAGLPASFEDSESRTSDEIDTGDGSPSSFVLRPSSAGDGTSSSFVLRPSSGRLYKTGDLARWRLDGTLEYLGRIDHQVKLHGYRIELGEIESALLKHPDVCDAAVLLREDQPGLPRLVAYVVPREELAPEVLRAALQEELLPYMLPSAFVALERIPLTPNGKVDRAALPAPERPQTDAASTAPRTAIEQTLAAIWSSALGVGPVGRHDNFFALGGDSILSIQVVSRARQAGLALAPRDLFQHPTVAELAAAVRSAVLADAEQGPVTGPAPLTPIQHWFFAVEQPEPQHWNQSLLLELRQQINPIWLEQALATLLHVHDALRLRFTRDGEGWRQRFAPPDAAVPLSCHGLADLPDPAPEIARIAAELQASLDLTDGPLIRAAWFDLGPERPGRLLLVIHHLAVDGVSWRILLEDLHSAYLQRSRAAQISLPRKTTAFKRWAEYLADYAGSDSLRGELPFWLGRPWARVAPLPVDWPDGANREGDVRIISQTLSAEETDALLHAAPRAYRTQINDLLLTALGRSLAAWTDADTALVNLEGHGREELSEQIDLTRTVGWFTTIFPVLLDLAGADTPEQALKSVKEQLRAIPNRGLGYGVLRHLCPDPAVARALGELPQAEVSFNYLGQVEQGLADTGMFALASESGGRARSQLAPRRHQIEVAGSIVGERLRLDWAYSGERHRREQIELLAARCTAELRGLIAHCARPDAGGSTPSDFPLARIDQATLDRLARAAPAIDDLYPLSPMQQGMLFHSLYAPRSGVYVEQLVCTLRGQLDLAAFEQAWQRAIDRHPLLRTSFHWEGLETPLQIVHRQVGLPWELHDWRGPDEQARAQRLAEFAQSDRASGFALDRAPLLRLALIQTHDDTYTCVWTFHHLLMDGWSVPVLFRDIFASYDALRLGQPLQLPPARPYRDYIAWLQRQDAARAEAFWRRTLAGFAAPTALPAGRTGAPAGAEAHAEARRQLDPATAQALQQFARQHHLTLNTLVQGAWALLLSRYSGDPDVLFGVTVAGRPAELDDIASMVGLFINTLPLRVRVDAGQELLDWLRQLQASQADLREYEYSPLAQIQSWSELPRGQALFESLLVFENYPVDTTLSVPREGLAITGASLREQTNYPLTLVVVPGATVDLRISYDLRRLDAAAANRLLAHLGLVFEAMLAAPHQPLDAITLVTPAERERLLAWGSGAAAAEAALVHARVALQARRQPDATAVSCGGRRLSFAELDRLSNRVAHGLRRLGVGPETVVGAAFQRGLDLPVALLGILKAGAAYLPIEPAAPPERLAWMLAETRAPVVLTDHPEAALPLPDGLWDGSVWALPAILADERLPASPPAEQVARHNLAYVIYTSGSTGRPKGAMITHSGLANYLDWAGRAYPLESGGGAPVHSSIGFDLTVTSLWAPLAAGRPVDLVPEDAGVTGLAEALRAGRDYSLVKLTPAHLELLGQLLTPEQARGSARALVIGGEALTAEAVRFWREHAPETRLINEYGPTETVVGCSIHTVAPDDPQTGALPIGRPIANTQLYVLDRGMRLAPIGVIGELYIGGAGVARGYLGRPDLTAERFVPNPFVTDEGRTTNDETGLRADLLASFEDRESSPSDGSRAEDGSPSSFVLRPSSGRIYKTGDLARWLPDGSIEYLGRGDDQIKIRGYRIELGEIDRVVEQHPAVQRAVTVAREDAPGQKRLVAYIVPAAAPGASGSPSAPAAAELRTFLAARLPDYMIPAAFVPLERLPLTVNGKVDRRALPAPDAEALGAADFAAPATPEEQALAEIWATVLGRALVGREDNFFSLGGDSIHSIRVLALAQERGLRLTLQQLFQAQNLRELAAALAAAEQAEAAPPAVQPFELISPEDRQRLPAGVEDAYPLARLQAGMLFHGDTDSGAALYHNINSFHIRAPFDGEALRTAVRGLVARHPALRTAFDLHSFGEPLQLVYAEAAAPLEIADLRGLLPGAQERALAEWFAAEQRRRFDWTRAPLLRFSVHLRSDDTLQFSFAMHHAILDGWSVATMLTELFRDYLAAVGGAGAAAPAPPALLFRDTVASERRLLASEQARAYWLDRLAESQMPLLPRWPAQRRAPGAAPVRVLQVPVAPELSASLHRYAQRLGVPLKSALLAAHLRVLGLLTGQPDVVTGLVANARPEGRDGERILGLFLNTLPLRLRLGSGSWRELIQATFETERDMLPFRQYPLAEIQKMFGGRPLFEAAFNFVHFHVYQAMLQIDGVQVLDERSSWGTNFTLLTTFSVDPASAAVALMLDYDPAQLCEEQVARIGGYYARALAALAAEQDWGAFDPLGEEEHRLLAAWNATSDADPLDRTLMDVFEAQVRRSPHAPAVLFEGRTLSYAELNARANQLARYLRARGVARGALVGIALERSLELVVGLYAILKAGAAYVPIDPSYPAERRQWMLEDARPPVVLTAGAALPEGPWTAVDLLAEAPLIAREPAGDFPSGAGPASPAYMIYTSGSTGRPKGALIDHAAIVNRLRWMQDAYQLAPGERVLQKTPFSFDVSVWEFFWPLQVGAALVVARPEGHKDSAYLVELIQRERVSTLHFVPSMLQIFLEDPGADACATLRRVICSGEALPFPLQQRCFERLPQAELHNLYGPTEAAVDVSSWACRRDDPRALVPIGRPIANTQLYVLDAEMRQTPVGTPGELYIGGVQLAHGYHRRPDLTAERFVPNPFAERWSDGTFERWSDHSDQGSPAPTAADEGRTTKDEAGAEASLSDTQKRSIAPTLNRSNAQSLQRLGARLYKTGDLARWLPDGSIEYLGRIDEQVKIRGFRIELGEIEAALREHPLLADAAVLAREDAPGQKRLVAYLVPADQGRTTEDEGPADIPPARESQPAPASQETAGADRADLILRPSSFVAELRVYLAGRLPDYMVPQAFVPLERLPLTPSGKLDRRALPAPQSTRAALDTDFVAPRTPVEAALAEIWSLVLRVAQVGVRDNFFTLGGDSILAMQIVARARQSGLRITPLQVFQHPTVAALAELAEHAPVQAAEQGLVTGEVPLMPIQRWFFEQELPDPHHFNQTLLLLVRQPLQYELLGQAVERLVDQHDALRLQFTREADGWRQTYAAELPAGVVSRIDLSAVAQDQIRAAVEEVAQTVQTELRLTGPLLRVVWFDLGPGRAGRLLIAVHHLVVDGVSWRILLDDLQTAYAQLLQGQPVALPPKTTSFKQWAERLRAEAGSDELAGELVYWSRHAGFDARLPTDRDGRNTVATARQIVLALTAEETEALLYAVPPVYQTQINDVLLTALALAFEQWTGQSALLLDLEGHGRETLADDLDVSRTVGWFTALFPLLLELPQTDDLGVALKAIKEQVRAIPRRGLGYGLLRYLAPDPAAVARLAALPRAEVSFNYLGQTDQALAPDSLFAAASEAAGPTQHPHGLRTHRIEIIGTISGGQLRVAWIFSDAVHHAATVERLGRAYLEALRALIAHCQLAEEGGYTPSDFPEAELNQDELDSFFDKISRKE